MVWTRLYMVWLQPSSNIMNSALPNARTPKQEAISTPRAGDWVWPIAHPTVEIWCCPATLVRSLGRMSKTLEILTSNSGPSRDIPLHTKENWINSKTIRFGNSSTKHFGRLRDLVIHCSQLLLRLRSPETILFCNRKTGITKKKKLSIIKFGSEIILCVKVEPWRESGSWVFVRSSADIKEGKSAINLSNLGNFCQIWPRAIYLC